MSGAGALAGKAAVITGGGRGIGAAVARALAAAGAGVLLAARTQAQVEAVAGELVATGAGAWAARCDVTDPASVRALAEVAQRRLGKVDILINNAGLGLSAPIQKITLEDWNGLFTINATGTLLCTQVFLPGMIERRWGRVVNVASIAGLRGGQYIAAYSAAKHAVIGFTRSVAVEVGPYGVTVNAVCPGWVDTAMTAENIRRIMDKTGRTREQVLEAIFRTTPQRRLLSPNEVAHAVLSLCVEDARGVNGHALVIDGGAVAGHDPLPGGVLGT